MKCIDMMDLLKNIIILSVTNDTFDLKFNLKNLEVDDYEIIFTGLCEECRKDKK